MNLFHRFGLLILRQNKNGFVQKKSHILSTLKMNLINFHHS
jgi:hypothetical protein